MPACLALARQDIYHEGEYRVRLQILLTCGFLAHSEPAHPMTLTLKGKIAMSIMTMDELLITELLTGHPLSSLSPAQLVALLSLFVYKPNSSTPSATNNNTTSNNTADENLMGSTI
jgi:superfamily II RNA helicase